MSFPLEKTEHLGNIIMPGTLPAAFKIVAAIKTVVFPTARTERKFFCPHDRIANVLSKIYLEMLDRSITINGRISNLVGRTQRLRL